MSAYQVCINRMKIDTLMDFVNCFNSSTFALSLATSAVRGLDKHDNKQEYLERLEDVLLENVCALPFERDVAFDGVARQQRFSAQLGAHAVEFGVKLSARHLIAVQEFVGVLRTLRDTLCYNSRFCSFFHNIFYSIFCSFRCVGTH